MDEAADADAERRTAPPAEVSDAPLGDLSPDAVEYVYRQLLIPAFRPEELMSLEEVRATYGPSGTDPSIVVLAGGVPVAVMLGEWYVERRVLLLSYLAVDRRMRGTGVGSRLLREVLPGWSEGRDVLVLGEVDDPRRWPATDDGGDPRARLRFYDRLGTRLLPLRYFQPSLRAASPRVEGMLLLRLDRSPDVSGDLLAAFLEEYFTVCEGPASLADPPVSGLIAAAQALDLERDAWPVSRWPDIPAPSLNRAGP